MALLRPEPSLAHVEVDATLTVVPAEQESSFPLPVANVGVLLALSLAGGLLAVARRRA